MHLKTSCKVKVLMKMKFMIFLQKITNKFGEKFKFKANLKINWTKKMSQKNNQIW